jgi:hypothetical protein
MKFVFFFQENLIDCLVKGTDEEEEIAANCLWLVTNSKKCPNCSISIQKNEGKQFSLLSYVTTLCRM